MVYKIKVKVPQHLREHVDSFCEDFKIKKSSFVRTTIEYTYKTNRYNKALSESQTSADKDKEKLSTQVSFQIDDVQIRQLNELSRVLGITNMSQIIRYCIRNYLINMTYLILLFDSTQNEKG